MTKHLPGSFTGTGLEQFLRERGVEISADQVHRTHLGSLQGFLADIKRLDDIMR